MVKYTIAAIAATMLTIGTANAYGSWVTMYADHYDNRHNKPAFGYSHKRCVYSDIYSNEHVVVTVKGFCPSSIKYNPSTNQWKRW